ncbi:RDD family protein [Paenibacillus pedocola]|uniref:RDD family protein n=1 Tax=Paenibacillus pedocola TaxID=3242193 RepID=UPI002877ADB6|nr:RDD family protein [Paenibacillus typhae]
MEQDITERLAEYDYVGFWQRVLISLLDFLILAIPAYFLNRWAVSAAEQYHSGIPLWIQWVLLTLFNIFMVVRYGGTPGRLVLRTRIVNERGEYPTVKQAFIRYTFYLINSLLGVIVTAGDGSVSGVDNYYSNWVPLCIALVQIVSLVILIDCLIIVFSRRNRAFHDVMADTYVVKKAALDELK